jgi:hypothetical protein
MQTKIHNLQTTNNIKNRKKTKVGALWLAPHFVITNTQLGCMLNIVLIGQFFETLVNIYVTV